jgi:nucleoredoxin
MKKFSFILVLVLCLTSAVTASDMIKAAGSELIDSSGKKTDTVPSGKIIGFYFSAHWCPPCKTFTPKLVKFYSALKEEGRDFEIIFVSSDKSKAEMMRYMKETEMPWVAIPYDSEEMKAVKKIWRTELDLKGIPSLVILRDGQVIAKEGRRDVTASGTAAYQKWLTMDPEKTKLPAETEASIPDSPCPPHTGS